MMGTIAYFRHRGHRINVDVAAASVRYEDGVPYDDEERPCTACGLSATNQRAPDPCLGRLDDVLAACCGHGRVHSAYVALPGRAVLTGYRAAEFFADQGCRPARLREDGDPTIGEQLRTRTMAWFSQGAALLRPTIDASAQAVAAFRDLARHL